MDAMRKQLDVLMGANRNGDVTEVNRKYYDRDVCRLFLAGLCPHDLFQLTKMDLGPCSKVHSLQLRKEYEEAKASGIHSFDRELEDLIDRLIVECERKIQRALKRLEDDDAKAAIAISVTEVTETPETLELSKQIKEKLKEVDAFDFEGKTDNKIRALEVVEELRAKRADKQSILLLDAFRLVQEAGQSILKSSAVHSMRAGKRARRNDDGDEPATMAGQQHLLSPPLQVNRPPRDQPGNLPVSSQLHLPPRRPSTNLRPPSFAAAPPELRQHRSILHSLPRAARRHLFSTSTHHVHPRQLESTPCFHHNARLPPRHLPPLVTAGAATDARRPLPSHLTVSMHLRLHLALPRSARPDLLRAVNAHSQTPSTSRYQPTSTCKAAACSAPRLRSPPTVPNGHCSCVPLHPETSACLHQLQPNRTSAQQALQAQSILLLLPPYKSPAPAAMKLELLWPGEQLGALELVCRFWQVPLAGVVHGSPPSLQSDNSSNSSPVLLASLPQLMHTP